MRNNHGAAESIPIFDVTSSLRNEAESIRLEDAENLRDPSRLGMNHFLPNFCFFDKREVLRRSVFKVQLHRLTQGLQRFFACLAEAGDIHVEALRNVEFVLAIQAVSDFPHCRKTMRRDPEKQPPTEPLR